eukprot:jgi/Mesen1/4700/ME000241S03738
MLVGVVTAALLLALLTAGLCSTPRDILKELDIKDPIGQAGIDIIILEQQVPSRDLLSVRGPSSQDKIGLPKEETVERGESAGLGVNLMRGDVNVKGSLQPDGGARTSQPLQEQSAAAAAAAAAPVPVYSPPSVMSGTSAKKAGPQPAQPPQAAGPLGTAGRGPSLAGGSKPLGGGPKEVGSAGSGSLLCWSSSQVGGYGGGGLDGVTIYGDGCSVCHVGASCSFTIRVLPPARWALNASEYSTGVPFKKELMVTLQGPALAHGYVTPDPLSRAASSVTFRTWDAGVYRVSVRAGCGNLDYKPGYEELYAHEFATWNLTVLPAEPAPSSCSDAVYARWLLVDGAYRWTPYPCAPTTPAGAFVARMHERGVRELNFVGDSHQRTLFHHVYALVSGVTDQSKAGWHGDLAYVAQQGGRQLKMNFYWLDGIYTNHEFGCLHRGEYSKRRSHFPEISRTADVTILNAGHWTWYQCPLPERAWAARLPDFLDWSQANATRKPGAKTVYRSTTTWASDKFGCRARTNANFVWANEVARGMLQRYEGIEYFDGWQVEAPRYLDTCHYRDFHYSCYKPVMSGAVGEALALSMMHYLAHVL